MSIVKNRLNRTAILICILLLTSTITALAQDENVLTWHNNNERQGLNRSEKFLTHDNVNAEYFGKVGFFATDGVVDAEPLHVSIKIDGKKRDALVVATEHDSVYAFDAQNGAILWHTSLLKSGETPSDDRECNAVSPEIGITATPVIDFTKGPHGAIYIVAMSKNSRGRYYQRLSALDLATGKQLFGGPTNIEATYEGDSKFGQGGKLTFQAIQYLERAALLEWNGAIYTAWSSHCDYSPYNGWIIAYSASTLRQTSVLNLTPNGGEGSIWMSGAGLASTPTRILFMNANGNFDTDLDNDGFPRNRDFGNTFIQLMMSSKGILQVHDYYATDATVHQSENDIDMGSGGVLLFPQVYDRGGIHHDLAVGAGKDGNIYVVNRSDMGKYHPDGGAIYQVLTNALPNGEFGAPAYFNNKLYYGGVSDNLKSFEMSDAKIESTPASRTTNTFPYPGTTPSISANGTANGIVWAVSHSNPSVLYAYNAENLSEQLYASDQWGGRDKFGAASHFVTPMISNGRVYIGTTRGVAVFGLLPR
jgi:hypothetical protein